MTNMSFVHQSGISRSTARVYLAVLLFLFVVLQGYARAQVSVTISPTTATLATLATQPFTATVSGNTNTAVTWQVNGVSGGNSTVGLVSTTVPGTSNEALYLGPSAVPSPATVSVTAVSQADPTKSASATVTLQVPSRSGSTFFVSTTGNDANAGTSTAPWRTIQHAANSVHPGDTVQVMGGVYNESVTIPGSGNATTGYITFESALGQTAILDGTGINVAKGQEFGLFTLRTNSYIVVQGFEIRNFQSSTSNAVPVGIDFEGSGSNIEILNNHIHNIVQTLGTCNSANALAMAIYGTQAPTSISNITISGNELDHNTTGCSENMSLDGNVQFFAVTKNLVHDNDNIGIDNIGFEGVAPNVSFDQARDGWDFQNTIFNITAANNPVYHGKLGANGQYCDGCTRVIIERNLIHDSDIPVEVASEHAGHVSSFVAVRNNVIYRAQFVGMSIGGFSSKVGGTDHCTIVNNTLWADGTARGASGELQIQYNATNNTIFNNIMYAGPTNVLINDFTSSVPNPASLDHNLYFATVVAASSLWNWQSKSITGYTNYQAASGQDANSPFADPQFDNIATLPPNLDVVSTSPAVNAGTNLGVNIVGVFDFGGNPRVNGSGQINIGAYEQ
ncbi:MAG: hypothetical protein DMG96_14475 [Acidobacteria bacterium]|nr:MAG: hypothetical protein DMG96_14475 [Acidobacteriota bacterium]